MNAAVDSNSYQTMTARLNTDGVTVQRIDADPTAHFLQTNDNTTGSNNGGTWAATDDNERPTMFAVSSSDGISPVALYADSTGHLYVDSS